MNITGDIATPFRNRKGTLSQNVMVACDLDLNFTFISCGWEGSARDARVLRSAIRKGFRVPEGKLYLVDGGWEDTAAQPTVPAAPSTSTENEPKKCRTNGDVTALMEKYIEMKQKQIESKQADPINVDQYSIKNCVDRLNTMAVSREEKVKGLKLFKNAENRELFICVDMETALMCLQSEIALERKSLIGTRIEGGVEQRRSFSLSFNLI